MSELIPIWNGQDLAGAATLSPFTIPNNPNAKTLKINNQSRFWLYLFKTQTSVNVDRIEPFSYITIPYESDLSLKVDTLDAAASSLNPDREFVDYTTFSAYVGFSKGSTQFSGGTQSNVTNAQVPITLLYNNKATFTFPAGTTSASVSFPFLPDGEMIEFHKAFFYILSANGNAYTMSYVWGSLTFSDGYTLQSPLGGGAGMAKYVPTNISGTTWWEVDDLPSCANNFNVTLTVPNALSQADTITLYYTVDGNDTAIETPYGYGLPVMPSTSSMYSSSGTIQAANTSQTALSKLAQGSRKYLFFQNLSTSVMYINFGLAASAGAGSILLPANGGSITFDAGFVPSDAINVFCATAGAAYTCKYSY